MAFPPRLHRRPALPRCPDHGLFPCVVFSSLFCKRGPAPKKCVPLWVDSGTRLSLQTFSGPFTPAVLRAEGEHLSSRGGGWVQRTSGPLAAASFWVASRERESAVPQRTDSGERDSTFLFCRHCLAQAILKQKTYTDSSKAMQRRAPSTSLLLVFGRSCPEAWPED